MSGCKSFRKRQSLVPTPAFDFQLSTVNYLKNRTAIPLTVSWIACVIIPGRKLFLHCARIPNINPYTVITIAGLTPW